MKEGNTVQYHVFTDGQDDWTTSKREAFATIKAWKADGYENLRIYEERYSPEDEERIEENCIYSVGDFPW